MRAYKCDHGAVLSHTSSEPHAKTSAKTQDTSSKLKEHPKSQAQDQLSKMPMFNGLEEALGHPPVRNSLIPTSFQPKQTQVESSHQNPATAPAVQTEAVQSKRVQPMKIPEAIKEEPSDVKEAESSASDGSSSKSKST